MSRSYKKSPISTDQSTRRGNSKHGGRTVRFLKRHANKKVRKCKNVANGSAYKKVSESWDISDYAFCDWGKPILGDLESIDEWNKVYRRK